MGRIQVDMFEVQLGASILVQIEEDNGQVWRILADGGIDAAGYATDHVAGQLPDVINSFQATSPAYPIHLMVGTHYDKDHLTGLVEVVNDNNFNIQMAWVPPVANDAISAPLGDTLDDDDFLSRQFTSANGTAIFNHYIDYQLGICQEMEELQGGLTTGENTETFNLGLPFGESSTPQSPELETMFANMNLSNHMEFNRFAELQRHLHESARWLPEKFRGNHDDYIYEDESFVSPEFRSIFAFDTAQRYFRYYRDPSYYIELAKDTKSSPIVVSRAALIRKSSAHKAITATYLNQLVQALRQKNVPFYNFHIIAGQPKFFVAAQHGFKPTTEQYHKTFKGPKLTLLGPSDELIKKHRDRLPVSMARLLAISLETISTSNQLSYVLIVEFEGQRILITGDAGFSDFNPKPKAKYFPDLLAQLYHLNVVQVAHHAGNNHHFYRVLHQSKYANDKSYKSHLLLSHAVRDNKRPTPAFDEFVSLLEDSCKMSLCFTSEPLPERVSPFKHLINKDTGYPVNADKPDRGNIRLRYTGKRWSALNPN